MRWKFGAYIFDPAKNILEGPQGKTLLEPKASALLSYFIQNPGRDLSRDELLQHVWNRQIVSDGAINRVVVQLRKSLKDDAKIKHLIVTVPKIGYRFVGALEQITGTPPNTSPSSWRRHILVLLGSIILLSMVALFFLNGKRKQEPTANANLSPVVRLANEQFDASLSPHAEQLVFSQKTDNGSLLLWARPSLAEPKRIGAGGGTAEAATWAPQDDMLVYRFIEGSACAFHIVRFHDGAALAPQAIYECTPSARVSFAFSIDGKKLYFSEQISEFAPANIYELDMATRTTRRMPQPQATGRGNFYIDRNPRSGNLLLLTDEAPGQTSAFELSPETNSFSQLMAWNHKVDFAIWGHAEDTIVHPGAHPSYQLMESNYHTGSRQILVSDSRRIKEPARIANGRDYLFTSYLRNQDVLLDGQLTPNLNSSVMDYLATLSRSGTQLAFISKRTGESRIWLANIETGHLAMLGISEPGQSFLAMDWSFDDKQLLVTTSAGLRVIDLATQMISYRLDPALPAYAARWSAQDEISYSLREGGRWQLYRHNIEARKTSTEESRWAFALTSTETSIFLDQKLRPFSANGDAIDTACTTALKFQDMNMRLYKHDLFCISSEAPTNILRYKNNIELATFPHAQILSRHFSVSKGHIAQTALTSAVSDIMRTNFEARQ